MTMSLDSHSAGTAVSASASMQRWVIYNLDLHLFVNIIIFCRSLTALFDFEKEKISCISSSHKNYILDPGF